MQKLRSLISQAWAPLNCIADLVPSGRLIMIGNSSRQYNTIKATRKNIYVHLHINNYILASCAKENITNIIIHINPNPS
jgi:hypothetical protein